MPNIAQPLARPLARPIAARLDAHAITEGVGGDPFYGPALVIGTPSAAAGWAWDDATKTATHTPGNTAALKVPVAALVAQNDYQLNFTHSGRTVGSVDLVMSDGASATFNKMTGTVDDNSTNWFVTFEAPTGAAYIELRPLSAYDGVVTLESVRKIIWDYTIPTPVIQKYYSWSANSLVVQLACPTAVPTVAAPTVEYSGWNATDASFGFASSAVAGNIANDYYGHDLVGGDCDIFLKIRNANQIVIQNAWLEHLAYAQLADGGSVTGGGLLFGGINGDKNVAANYDAVKDIFICDYMADWNEQSNLGDFVWNTGDPTFSGYNRDQINLESVHPTYQAASRCDVINTWGKNAADAMIDNKRPNCWVVCCTYEGSSFRALGLHGFDPAGLQGFRGQPTEYVVGCQLPDMAADGVASSSPFFMSQYCTFELFGDWVANRRVVDAAQAVARTFVRTGDGYLGTPDDTTFKVRRTPLRGQDARNRIPFLKHRGWYSTVGPTGPWTELPSSRPGPFPAGYLGWSGDPSSLGLSNGQQIWLYWQYGTHNAWVDSAVVSVTVGGSISAEKLTNGDMSSATGWTLGSFTISGGVASHSAGGGTGVLSQPFTSVLGQGYRVAVDVVTFTASVCPPQLSGGTTVAYPTLNRAGSHRSYRKAALNNNTFRFNPNTAFAGSLDNASLRAVSLTGPVT